MKLTFFLTSFVLLAGASPIENDTLLRSKNGNRKLEISKFKDRQDLPDLSPNHRAMKETSELEQNEEKKGNRKLEISKFKDRQDLPDLSPNHRAMKETTELEQDKNVKGGVKKCKNLKLSVTTDGNPEETTVKAVELNSWNWIWWDERFDNPNQKYDLQKCVDPSGCYEVFIMDSEGDGIDGTGFNLKYNNRNIASGGAFTNYAVYDVGNGCASRPACETMKIEITTDNYPRDTTLYLYDWNTDTMDWADTILRKKNKKYEFSKCLDPLRCYEMAIFDIEGDGFEANKGYKITYGGEVIGTDEDDDFTDAVYYYIGECGF